MAQRMGKIVSVPTLWRSLNFCGITRKKVRIQYTLILLFLLIDLIKYFIIVTEGC